MMAWPHVRRVMATRGTEQLIWCGCVAHIALDVRWVFHSSSGVD